APARRLRGGAALSRLPAPSKNGHATAPLTNGSNGAPPPAKPKKRRGSAGRGTGGHFAKGNKGGPGNPFARQVAARPQALLAAGSDDDVAAVGKKLLALALAGDVPAAKVLLAHVLGKPAPAADPDHLDLSEFKLLASSPNVHTVGLAMAEGVNPGLAARLA